MNILYLLSQRPELTGSGVYVTAMMACAARKGHHTALVAGTPHDCELPEGALPETCTYYGDVRFGLDLPFPVTGMSDIMPYPSTCWRELSEDDLSRYEACFADALRRAVRDFSPDIIHSNHLWLLTALARELFPDRPLVASCHGSDLRQCRSLPRLAARITGTCQRLDAALALSQAQADDIHTLYGIPRERIHVTGAGYSEALFYTNPSTTKQQRPFCILYAGKLSRAKGVPWLLRACETLSTRGLDFRLDLCGSGSGHECEECQQLADASNGRVVRHGNVAQSRLAELMRAADVFVLPSFFEGVPLVLLEALACGCRLVATDLPGVREVFADMPLSLIRRIPLPRLINADVPVQEDEPAFISALADALEAQCHEQESPTCSHQRDELLRRYTWDGVFDKVQRVLFELCGGTPF